MQTLVITCPCCLGTYSGPITSKSIVCNFCGTRYALTKEELASVGFVDADGDGYDDNDVEVPVDAAEDSWDESDDPMDVYASDACGAFLDDVDEDYKDSFDESRKIAAGLDISRDEEIYLIHDDTFFKSGKNGFAITSDGLYCREMNEKRAHFVSWEDFAKGEEPAFEDSYIRQDDVSLCYFTDTDALKQDLEDLYVQLWEHARHVC